MPHLICPTCRLTSYSAAGHARSDRCPRWDTALAGEKQAEDVVRRWTVDDLRHLARQEGVEREALKLKEGLRLRLQRPQRGGA
jgi:hypothetical protein